MTLRAIPAATADHVETLRRLRNVTAAGYAFHNEQISAEQQATWWEASRGRVQAWLYLVDGPSADDRSRSTESFDVPIIYRSDIVGFGLLATHDDGTVWTTVGVHPEHGGHNYGKAITHDLVVRAPGQLHGSARRDNPAAVKLHVAADWDPVDGPDARLAYFRSKPIRTPLGSLVGVVVASYNRPRMLGEALRSIEPGNRGANLVIVADDGSDYDVETVATRELAGHVILGERKTPAARMETPSCGALLNEGLRLLDSAGGVYAAILSDDDLFAPGWLAAARDALDQHPEWHMVCGRWGLFNDGEQPDPAKRCTFGFELPLTAGNFLYRLSCATEEDCWWCEDSLAVHDGPMLWNYMRVHGFKKGKRPPWLGQLDLLAGYRREHAKTISNNSLFGGDRYMPRVVEMFAGGLME